jgi:hypothetical protein
VRRSMTNRIGLTVIAGCIAVGSLAVAGCGGGGSSSTTGASGVSGASGSAPLTKKELAMQANAICKEVNTQVEALPAQAGLSTSAAVSEIAKLVAIGQAEFDKQEALTPPSDQRSDWKKFLVVQAQRQALLQKELDVARAGDKGQLIAVIKQLEATARPYLALTTSLGLTECAKTPQPQG